MGPFYCPADSTVYIDLSFYDDMKKAGADGDFAQGYVIAHEVGHHVQKLLGIESKVRQLQQNASQTEVNRLSVKMELQADCFAGVWGHSMQKQGVLETGDLQEALNAARPSATIACSSGARDAWCRTASPMAPLNSATPGSNAVSTAAIRRSAIPLAARCDRVRPWINCLA
jgi:hypothetical protein